nr:acetylornithine transaminase [Pelobacter seleniigenes]
MQQSNFNSLLAITNRPPVVMVEGHGSWLIDSDGKRYLDFIQGWAVNCLGHTPSLLVEAVNRQAARLFNPSPAFYNDQAIRLANLLTEHSCLDRVFFTNCGAEANEGAIKLARKWGSLYKHGAYEIITMDNSFHGRTLATMSASGKPKWKELFEPKVPGFIQVPFNDLAAVAAAVSEHTVAIMVEPIQGEAGVIPATKEFLHGLRQLADKENLLLILDEVQTGMGRTGTLFAYQQAEAEPDIMTLGKGIGGGVPLAAVLAKEMISCFEPGDQGGTYNGNPLMTAVGVSVMEAMLESSFFRKVQENGEFLRKQLEELSRHHGLGVVRGSGMLLALLLPTPIASTIAEQAFEQGLIINAPRPDVLRFMPALNVSREEIETCITILGEVLTRCK